MEKAGVGIAASGKPGRVCCRVRAGLSSNWEHLWALVWRQLLAPWSAKQVDGEGVGIAASGKSGRVCCRVPSMCHPLELDNCCHESFASSTPLSGSDITASHGLIEISVFEGETLLHHHEITYCVADSVLNLLREPLDSKLVSICEC